jgi:hypothetical protein
MKAATKRNRIWQHNGLFGSVRMAEMAMYAIIKADSTTLETKKLADELAPQLRVLYRLLQKRIDPK